MTAVPDKIFDTIIVGAGAAGLCLGYLLGRSGLKVLVLEAQGRAGRKLLLSGGGKCNVTNLSVSADNYVGANPEFRQTVLRRLAPTQVIAFLNEHKIAWEERDYGQVFLKQGADRLRDLLLCLAEKYGTTIALNNPVLGVGRENHLLGVSTSVNHYRTRSLVLSTGSPAWPASGSNLSGYLLAEMLGHSIIPPKPALTPLPMPRGWPLQGLAGINLPVRIFLTEGLRSHKEYTLPLLITHQGISGPAALQISLQLEGGEEIGIDWLPTHHCEALFNQTGAGKRLLSNLLSAYLPARLVAVLIPDEIAGRKAAELSRAQRDEVARRIHDYRLTPSSPDFSRAEACRGGVPAGEINPFSMESLFCKRLFFAGEIVDVCGELGGYNLHWAWASAVVAANGVVERLEA